MKNIGRLFLILSMCILALSSCSASELSALKKIKPDDISYINVSAYKNNRKIEDTCGIAANLAALNSITLNGKSGEAIQTGTTLEFVLKNGQSLTITFGNGLVCFGNESYRYTEKNNPTLN